jgi:hypothetical protein
LRSEIQVNRIFFVHLYNLVPEIVSSVYFHY